MDRIRKGWSAVVVAVLLLGTIGCGGTEDASEITEPSSTTEMSEVTGSITEPATRQAESTGRLVLSEFARGLVDEQRLEAIGCWLGGEGDADTVLFFGGFGGGLIVVDDQPVILQATPGAADIDAEWNMVDSYRSEAGDLTIEIVSRSDPGAATGDSSIHSVELNASSGGGGTFSAEGLLECGV
jgi:hypothetical protein